MIIERTINIVLDGNVQQVTTESIQVRKAEIQSSNENADTVYGLFVLDPDTPPADIDGTNAGFDLGPGQSKPLLSTTVTEDRGEQVDLKHYFVKGPAGNLYVTYLDEVFYESIT